MDPYLDCSDLWTPNQRGQAPKGPEPEEAVDGVAKKDKAQKDADWNEDGQGYFEQKGYRE